MALILNSLRIMKNINCLQTVPFSRCMICNGSEFVQISQEEMREARKNTNNDNNWKVNDVKESVVENNQVFNICNKCGKVYWEGKAYLLNYFNIHICPSVLPSSCVLYPVSLPIPAVV